MGLGVGVGVGARVRARVSDLHARDVVGEEDARHLVLARVPVEGVEVLGDREEVGERHAAIDGRIRAGDHLDQVARLVGVRGEG